MKAIFEISERKMAMFERQHTKSILREAERAEAERLDGMNVDELFSELTAHVLGFAGVVLEVDPNDDDGHGNREVTTMRTYGTDRMRGMALKHLQERLAWAQEWCSACTDRYIADKGNRLSQRVQNGGRFVACRKRGRSWTVSRAKASRRWFAS